MTKLELIDKLQKIEINLACSNISPKAKIKPVYVYRKGKSWQCSYFEPVNAIWFKFYPSANVRSKSEINRFLDKRMMEKHYNYNN